MQWCVILDPTQASLTAGACLSARRWFGTSFLARIRAQKNYSGSRPAARTKLGVHPRNSPFRIVGPVCSEYRMVADGWKGVGKRGGSEALPVGDGSPAPVRNRSGERPHGLIRIFEVPPPVVTVPPWASLLR